jgi:hypothetical protein
MSAVGAAKLEYLIREFRVVWAIKLGPCSGPLIPV